MTLPDERYRSIKWAEKFLRELGTDTKKYPRVPKTVRREALSVLRHFPTAWDLDQLAAAAPHVVIKQMEPLHKMVLEYEMGEAAKEDLCPPELRDTL